MLSDLLLQFISSAGKSADPSHTTFACLPVLLVTVCWLGNCVSAEVTLELHSSLRIWYAIYFYNMLTVCRIALQGIQEFRPKNTVLMVDQEQQDFVFHGRGQ